MSIPYIPGWWDEISKSATGLASQLPRQIQPDTFAKRQLEEMIKQNPMVLEQMSNMDEGTRRLLEQTMGFKNQSPISQLPVGVERQMREMKMGALKDVQADPEAAVELRAGLTGTLRPDQRRANQLALQNAETTLEGRIIDNKTGEIKLQNLERESKRLQGILDKAAPDLAPTARALAFGGQVSTDSLQRIYADDTLRGAFQDYYRAFQFEREANLRKTLQSMRTPQERLMAVAWVEKELDNTRAQVTDLRNKLRGREGFFTKLNEPLTFQADTQKLSQLEGRLKELENAYADEVKKFGGTLPKNEAAPVTPGPMANSANRPSLSQLDNLLFRSP